MHLSVPFHSAVTTLVSDICHPTTRSQHDNRNINSLDRVPPSPCLLLIFLNYRFNTKALLQKSTWRHTGHSFRQLSLRLSPSPAKIMFLLLRPHSLVTQGEASPRSLACCLRSATARLPRWFTALQIHVRFSWSQEGLNSSNVTFWSWHAHLSAPNLTVLPPYLNPTHSSRPSLDPVCFSNQTFCDVLGHMASFNLKYYDCTSI